MKTSILFWNVGGKVPTAELRAITLAERPEVIVLAECPASPTALLEAVNADGALQYHLPLNYSRRLKFLVALPKKNYAIVFDDKGVSVRRIVPIDALPFLLVAVHLTSKLFNEGPDQAQLVTRLARIVAESERDAGHSRTIVIGDLNMNPFEPGVIGSEGLHAVSTRSVAVRGNRVVAGEERPFFYNPMWSCFGDDSAGPPGTYYRAMAKPISYNWHMFDQALLRPAFLTRYVPGDVRILTSAGSTSLLGSGGIPDRAISDHLPVIALVGAEEVRVGVEEPVG